MITIIKTEFLKLKRYNIILSGIFMMLLSVVLTIFTSTANDGSFWDFRYLYEQVIKNNMTLIFPVCITLISGYIMNREYDNDTMKNILTVPISYKKLVFCKLIVCGVVSILFGFCCFVFTIIGEKVMNYPGFTVRYAIEALFSITANSLFLYIATMPIIVLSWRKQKGYLIGAIAAFVYGYSGLLASSKMALANIYPITATLGLIGYRSYDVSVNWNIGLNIISIALMILLSILITIKTNINLDNSKEKKKKVKTKKGW